MTRSPGSSGKFSRRRQKPELMFSRRAPSLKLRLLAATLAGVAVSIAVAGALATWHAKAGVRDELASALAGGESTIGEALEAATDTPFSDAQIDRTIRSFNSSRHLRVTRTDPSGRVTIASSPPRTTDMAPAWFERLFDPHLAPRTIPIPVPAGGGEVRLAADPQNELAEVWRGFRDLAVGLLVFMAVGFVLIYRTVGLALRPLDEVARAMGRVGRGDYTVTVSPPRSAEIEPVAQGLNAMAARLLAMETYNRRLQEQLLSLQEEERVEIARDLHDEVGPYLFAVNIDAAAIAALAANQPRIGERASMIQQAVSHMQSHVRDMLGRLRPVRLVEFGLEPAIRGLVEFWRSRQPAIEFELNLDFPEGAINLEEREALYRLVQEALANAMRHAKPARVSVRVRLENGGLEASVTNDGVPPRSGQGAPGFGLMGMSERIESLGGRLDLIAERENGWLVRAHLPRQTSPLESA
ncbi:MAG: Integral rane sensor signal transduction histidine kinase [Caulobacteraceae bacterium]|nr:Integral rane sensor signal transduction histidine kinase [Caulobacteraceae bacterium]